MSPSYVCPCCFLNRISILRESGGSGEHVEIRFNHGERAKEVGSEALTIASNTSISSRIFSDESQGTLNHLEDILEKLKSGVSFTPGLSDYNMNYTGDKYISGSSMESRNKAVSLAEQIDNVLKEQKKFLKELDLDLPIYEEEWFMVMGDTRLQSKNGDCTCDIGKSKSKTKNKEDFMKIFKKDRLTDSFFAGGDKLFVNQTSNESWTEETSYEDLPDISKPTMYFNDEPVKLPKPFQYTLTTNDSNLNTDFGMDKNISVKLLFFPEVELKGSSTSVMSDDCMSSASVYVTAANSVSEQVPAMYTTVESTSDFQLKTTQSTGLMC